MESSHRTIVKGVTWQILGLTSVSLLGYWQTGNWHSGITLALSAALTGFIFFFVHERIWARIGWGIKKHI